MLKEEYSELKAPLMSSGRKTTAPRYHNSKRPQSQSENTVSIHYPLITDKETNLKKNIKLRPKEEMWA